MDSYKFLGVLEIIKGSIKILPKNGKLMASIATLGLLLHSFSFLLSILFFKPFLNDMVAKTKSLGSESLSNSESSANLFRSVIKDTLILLGIELVYFLAYGLISLFVNTSTVYTSALSFYGHELSLKDLLLSIIRSFKRVFFTSFHVIIRIIGWILLFSIVLMTPTYIVFSNHPVVLKSLIIAFSVLLFIFFLHVSVVWALAFVVSVMEENCYGRAAIKKAEGLVKGRRVDGFVLNFVFNLFIMIINKVSDIIAMKSQSREIVVGLFITCISYLVTMFLFMAYTLFYFKCKKSHGEEIELRGKLVEYSKIPSTLLNEDMP